MLMHIMMLEKVKQGKQKHTQKLRLGPGTYIRAQEMSPEEALGGESSAWGQAAFG